MPIANYIEQIHLLYIIYICRVHSSDSTLSSKQLCLQPSLHKAVTAKRRVVQIV